MITERGLTYLCDGVSQSVSITGGPDRVVTDKPDPDFKASKVRFIRDEEQE